MDNRLRLQQLVTEGAKKKVDVERLSSVLEV
jgi:hypothetical protein